MAGKINVNTILKNLTGIFCGAIIICFLLPFFSASVSVSAGSVSSSNSEAMTGFQVLTEGGFFEKLLIVIPILIIIANYIPQIDKYKKIVSLVLSVANIVLLFIVPGQMSAQGGGGSTSMNVETSYEIGFWLMLIFSILIAVIALIQFFNLKGNKVFDTINSTENTTTNNTSASKSPKINLNKISDVAKNTASNVSSQIKNAANNTSGAVRTQSQSVSASNVNTRSVPNKVKVQEPARAEQRVVSVNNLDFDEATERIKKLYEMKEAGILTEQEFNAKKQEMLKSI